MKLRKWIGSVVFMIVGILSIFAQSEDASDIAKIVFLDSVVVKASTEYLDVETVIDFIIRDQSFYKAFRNLRLYEHKLDVSMDAFNRRGDPKGQFSGKFEQEVDDLCRSLDTISLAFTPKFFRRNGKPRYYTYQLIDRIFLTRGVVCEQELDSIYDVDDVEEPEADEVERRTQNHIQELKKLMFAPGTPVDLPLMGNKTAIFENRMRKFYDYSLYQDPETSGLLVFQAKLKENWVDRESRAVINDLIVYFDPKTMEIKGKKYWLDYRSMAYRFDVKLDVKISEIEGIQIPSTIDYDGFWKIPINKKENASFSIQITL